MTRSSNSQRAERINAAVALIQRQSSPAEAATALATQFSISKRQAYRYVKEAGAIGKRIPIPDRKVAFTVKLSQGLTQKLRQYSQSKGQTLSEIVTLALEAFLYKGRQRGQEDHQRD
jgi:predicted DNA-binding transcriptional regulator YafY